MGLVSDGFYHKAAAGGVSVLLGEAEGMKERC